MLLLFLWAYQTLGSAENRTGRDIFLNSFAEWKTLRPRSFRTGVQAFCILFRNLYFSFFLQLKVVPHVLRQVPNLVTSWRLLVFLLVLSYKVLYILRVIFTPKNFHSFLVVLNGYRLRSSYCKNLYLLKKKKSNVNPT